MSEKFDVCKTNPKISSTTKVKEHTPSGLSMSTISIGIENKNDVYRGKYCMKKDLWIFKRAGNEDNSF